jgi:hypothetical protein
MRPYDKTASYGVHRDPKGILFQLLGIWGRERVLLAGASNGGRADPGQAALISLMQCTVLFLTTAPNDTIP